MASSLLTNLVSAYNLDGNSNDSFGSNNGTDTAITYNGAYGKINSGALFNGTTSIINLGNPASLNLGSINRFSLAAWVYPLLDPTGCGAITEMYSPTSSTVMYELGFDMTSATDTKLQLGFHKAGVWYTATDTVNTLLNTWTHIAGTWDGTTLKAYKNSTLVASSNPGTAMPTTSYDSVRIGCRHDNFGPQPFFPGYMDCVYIWKGALTSDDIVQLYYGGGQQYPFNYTSITKTTSTTYSSLSGGRTMFDDSMTLFDASIPFDGLDLQYTNIPKASGTSYTNIAKAI